MDVRGSRWRVATADTPGSVSRQTCSHACCGKPVWSARLVCQWCRYVLGMVQCTSCSRVGHITYGFGIRSDARRLSGAFPRELHRMPTAAEAIRCLLPAKPRPHRGGAGVAPTPIDTPKKEQQ